MTPQIPSPAIRYPTLDMYAPPMSDAANLDGYDALTLLALARATENARDAGESTTRGLSVREIAQMIANPGADDSSKSRFAATVSHLRVSLNVLTDDGYTRKRVLSGGNVAFALTAKGNAEALRLAETPLSANIPEPRAITDWRRRVEVARELRDELRTQALEQIRAITVAIDTHNPDDLEGADGGTIVTSLDETIAHLQEVLRTLSEPEPSAAR